MKRLSVRLMINLLDMTGIRLYEGTFFEKYVRLFAISFSLCYTGFSISMYSIIHRENFNEFVITISYLFSTIFLLTTIVSLFTSKSKIRVLLERIDDNIYTYTQEKDIEVAYSWILDEKNTRKINALIFLYQLFGFALAGISPVLGYLFGIENQFMIYPAWMPLAKKGFLPYIGMLVIQLITAGSVFWGYYLLQVYVAFMVIELLRQHKRLKAALTSLSTRCELEVLRANAQQDGINNPHVWYVKLFKENLIQCIQHHQLLVK